MACHRVTHSFMTPTGLKRLADVPAPRERWKLATKLICTGGESVPGDVVRWVNEAFGIVVNCQPGQIMSAAALLARNASPSEADVESAMSGNLCRCGCYPRIKAAILEVAAATGESRTQRRS